MDLVFNFIFNVFSTLLGLMERFEFFGTNLLEFSLSLIVIGVMLPIVISLGKSVLTGTNGGYRERVSKKTR